MIFDENDVYWLRLTQQRIAELDWLKCENRALRALVEMRPPRQSPHKMEAPESTTIWIRGKRRRRS